MPQHATAACYQQNTGDTYGNRTTLAKRQWCPRVKSPSHGAANQDTGCLLRQPKQDNQGG
jgi:hypothetical protein